MDERAGDRHVALASAVRRQILELLREAPEPLDASAIAAECGLHVTTARFHLEQLESTGLVAREIMHRSARGRPRMVFRVVEQVSREESLLALSEVLADALVSAPDGGRASASGAGRRWSRTFAGQTAAGSGDDLGSLSRVFEQLGFAPELRADGQTLALHGCPFRDVASAHPNIVCSAHQGLLAGIVDQLGHAETEASLEPFVEPELCLVHLGGSLVVRGQDGTPAE